MSWTQFRELYSYLLTLSCLAVFPGCETNHVPSGARFVVAVPKAAFYKYGPAQAFGPDFQLNEDTKVTIRQYSAGFSHVTTSDGISGYMSTDDLKPAPPDPPTPEESAAAARKLRPLFPQKLKMDFPYFDQAPLPENSGLQKPPPELRN